MRETQLTVSYADVIRRPVARFWVCAVEGVAVWQGRVAGEEGDRMACVGTGGRKVRFRRQ
jgi:hypothetical protein